MNSIGIDISKSKRMIAILRPYGEIVSKPFVLQHSNSEIHSFIQLPHFRITMEHIKWYYEPLVRTFTQAGLFVSTFNPKLIKDFSDHSLRKVKSDKANVVKIARYGLDSWQDLRQYGLMDELRSQLKIWIGSSVFIPNAKLTWKITWLDSLTRPVLVSTPILTVLPVRLAARSGLISLLSTSMWTVYAGCPRMHLLTTISSGVSGRSITSAKLKLRKLWSHKGACSCTSKG